MNQIPRAYPFRYDAYFKVARQYPMRINNQNPYKGLVDGERVIVMKESEFEVLIKRLYGNEKEQA